MIYINIHFILTWAWYSSSPYKHIYNLHEIIHTKECLINKKVWQPTSCFTLKLYHCLNPMAEKQRFKRTIIQKTTAAVVGSGSTNSSRSSGNISSISSRGSRDSSSSCSSSSGSSSNRSSSRNSSLSNSSSMLVQLLEEGSSTSLRSSNRSNYSNRSNFSRSARFTHSQNFRSDLRKKIMQL